MNHDHMKKLGLTSVYQDESKLSAEFDGIPGIKGEIFIHSEPTALNVAVSISYDLPISTPNMAREVADVWGPEFIAAVRDLFLEKIAKPTIDSLGGITADLLKIEGPYRQCRKKGRSLWSMRQESADKDECDATIRRLIEAGFMEEESLPYPRGTELRFTERGKRLFDYLTAMKARANV